MSEENSLKPKNYVVTAPDGKEHHVEATTSKGAIAAAREYLRKDEEWGVRLATGQELLDAGRRQVHIIGATAPADDGQNDLPL